LTLPGRGDGFNDTPISESFASPDRMRPDSGFFISGQRMAIFSRRSARIFRERVDISIAPD
jgi:hypothetical protein